MKLAPSGRSYLSISIVPLLSSGRDASGNEAGELFQDLRIGAGGAGVKGIVGDGALLELRFTQSASIGEILVTDHTHIGGAHRLSFDAEGVQRLAGLCPRHTKGGGVDAHRVGLHLIQIDT